MKSIIIKIQKFVFFRTGIIMPTLKRKWERDAAAIQEGLNYDRARMTHSRFFNA